MRHRSAFLAGSIRSGRLAIAPIPPASAAPPDRTKPSPWWGLAFAIVSPDPPPTWGDVAHAFALGLDPDAGAGYRAVREFATERIAREIGARMCDPVRPTRAILDACTEAARRRDAARGEPYTPRTYLASWYKAVAE